MIQTVQTVTMLTYQVTAAQIRAGCSLHQFQHRMTYIQTQIIAAHRWSQHILILVSINRRHFNRSITLTRKILSRNRQIRLTHNI
jgi:hypothetical protein